MESKSIGTNPRVLNTVLAIMEDFAVKFLISVVACILADAVEFGLLQQLGQAVGFFLFVFELIFDLLKLLLLYWALLGLEF